MAAAAMRNTGIPVLSKYVAYVSVALSEDRHSVMAAGHRVLDMYAKLPFYVKMFADAGFPLTAGQMVVPDSLVDSLIVSGDEAHCGCGAYRTSGSRFGRSDGNSSADKRQRR